MIDWGLLKPTNALASYDSAFTAGRERGKELGVQSALGKYKADPMAAADELMKYDPELGQRLRKDAQAQQDRTRREGYGSQFGTDPQGAVKAATMAGDYDIATQLDQMNDEQIAETVQQAQTIAAVGQKLATMPYEDRKAAMATLGPALVARGFPQEQIAAFDPTDENIQAALLSVADLQKAVEPRIVTNGRTTAALNPNTGEKLWSYEAPADPLEEELKRARIAATGRSNQGSRGRAAPARSAAPSVSGVVDAAEVDWD